MIDYKKLLNEDKYKYADLSTVPIQVFNENGLLSGFGGSAIGNFREHRIVITVAHNFLVKGADYYMNAFLLMGLVPGPLSQYYGPSFEYVKILDMSDKKIPEDADAIERFLNRGDRIDFGYAVLDDAKLQPRDDVINPQDGHIYSADRKIHAFDFDLTPSQNDRFFFAGKVRQQVNHKDQNYQHLAQYVEDVKYVVTTPDSNFHIFQLPQKIQHLDDFRGCSGGPILNQKGEVVSLVVKGREGLNRLYGINLQKFRPAIEASILSKNGWTHFPQ